MIADRPADAALSSPTTRSWRATTTFAVIALGVVLVAFGLRVIRLDRPLWFDEGYSLYFAGVSPWETARLTASDIHPPLYYWFLQAWTLAVGWNEIAVRAASVAVGVVTVAVLMRFGRRCAGPIVPLSAGLMLALSPLHIAYSQEVRMYALLALFATLSVWAWWRLAYGGRWRIATYAAITGAALLTQYYAVFLVIGHALSLLFLGRAGRRSRLVAVGLAGVPFGAWSLYAAPELLAYVRGKVAFEGYAPLGPVEFLLELLSAFGGGGPLATAAGAALAALAVFGLIRRGILPSVRVIIACSLVAVVALGWVVNVVAPFHPPDWQRLYLFILPLLVFAAASGFWRLLRPTLRRAPPVLGWVAPNSVVRAAGLVCLALALGGMAPGLAFFYARSPVDDPRPMIRLINALSRPDDLVVAVYPWQIGYLRLYHARPLPSVTLVPADRWARDPTARATELRAVAESRPRVWFPAYQRLGHRLEDALEQDLTDGWFLVSSAWFGDHRLLLFGDGTPTSPPVAARFRDGVGVVVSSGNEATAGSGVIPVLMRWSSERPIPAGSVHLRLVDDRGVAWAQHDSALVSPVATTPASWPVSWTERRAVLAPAGTPPGQYRLLMNYSAGDGALGAFDPEGRSIGVDIPLGVVTITRPDASPPVEALFIARPQSVDVANGVRLLGASLSGGPFRPGDRALITLYWTADRAPTADLDATLHVGGSVVTETVGGAYAATRWRPGELVREIRPVVIRSDTPEIAPVSLTVAGHTIPLGSVRVATRTRVHEPPAMEISQSYRFAEGIRLVGASVRSNDRPLLPGQLARALEITLVWQTTRELTRDLAVFVHLVDADGRPLAQHDGRPANGDAPTAGWTPGEFIQDAHRLVVPAEVPPGTYRVIVGLYPPPNGARLAVLDSDGAPVGDTAQIFVGVLQ